MIVATAGHIDHGKTLLVKSLSGVDTDRLPDEKKREMSIDLGFAYKKLNNGMTLGFIDVPGHERFIRNMLAGVTGVDFALLVIAADDGPMSQTFEHLTIIDLLNISRGAVAITKIDKVGEERLLEVKKIVSNILKETSLSKSPIFPISNLNKKGIKSLHTYLNDQTIKIGKRNDSGNFRLAIDRKFILKGTGLVVTGTSFSGNISVGDQMIISPKGMDVRVRSIFTQGQKTEKGSTGQRCALNIIGPKLQLSLINRGDWVLSKNLTMASSHLDAKIFLSKTERKPLQNWSSAHLHLGAADVTCKIINLDNKKICAGMNGFVQLKLDRQIPAVFGDRFILRDQSAKRTIAGGIIIDPYPLKRKIKKHQRIELLKVMLNYSDKVVLLNSLKLLPWGIDFSQFIRTRNLTEIEAKILLDSLILKNLSNGNMVWVMSKTNWKTCSEKILKEIINFHRIFPNLLGIKKELIIKKYKSKAPEFVVNKIVLELVNLEQINQIGKVLKSQEHSLILNMQDRILWKRLETKLVESKLEVPTISNLAFELKINIKILELFLKRVTQMGYLVKIKSNRYILPKTLNIFINIAKKLAKEDLKGYFESGKFKDNSGIGRNLTIEVLEFFDKSGFTQRFKSGRIIKKSAEEAFDRYFNS